MGNSVIAKCRDEIFFNVFCKYWIAHLEVGFFAI